MPGNSHPQSVVRFGPFEADLQAQELRKNGVRLRLPNQSFQILKMLVERPGYLVSREEMHAALWSADTFVDFEKGINAAIKRLRETLGDSAETPRYVETLHRRGYRFIGTIPAQVQSAIQTRNASVAVLPFINLGGDPENEFFADGITEDVIAHLAKIRSLKVISRNSVMGFKKRECGLREIGEKLGASTLVDGSVRRVGNRVRIVAQLVDAASDAHIWAQTYDRDLTDIFAIQTDVALKIVNALRAELSNEERVRVSQRPTHNLEAYDFYLRGRDSLKRFTEEGYRRSLIEFDAAIALDPDFALAWASIAEVHALVSTGGGAVRSPEETMLLAKKAAARALEIDNELGEAHGVAGLIRLVFDFDWAGAERLFQSAIELSPGSADVHEHYGRLYSSLGRYDDALREVGLAREVDPLKIQTDVATTLLRAGRIEEALDAARRSVREQPAAPRCHSILGWALIFHGENAAGIAFLEKAVELSSGGTLFLSQLGEACGLCGDLQRAREILEQVRDRAKRQFVSPYHFAYIHAGLGDADAAMDALELAFQQRSGAVYGIKGSFLFKNLHAHLRFQSLLRRMNLS